MKLNIGCGKRYDPDYINVDLYDEIIADKKMSATYLEYDDNVCDTVKAIQVIEHLGFFKSLYALSEFFRVLNFNGELILETPDLEISFKNYLTSDYKKKKEILGWVFGIPHQGLQHKLCYPPEMLIEILKKIGFINVKTKRFYNPESIPTLRIECNKPPENDFPEYFKILTHIRKNLIQENYVHFKNSFLNKEQEDLLTYILIQLKKWNRNKNSEVLYQILITSLIRFPKITKSFLKTVENRNYFKKSEIAYISEIIDNLIELKFPSILCNSLMNLTIIPGTQRLALLSIESFGRKIIEKLLYSKAEKEEQLKVLRQLLDKENLLEINFFSSVIIKRKSEDYFSQGIKLFYLEKYKSSKKAFLTAIQLYRDDFLYYWNLGKVLFKLESKASAIRFYKRTLRLLRMSKVANKKKIKIDINQELKWIKKGVGAFNIQPVISLDKYISAP